MGQSLLSHRRCLAIVRVLPSRFAPLAFIYVLLTAGCGGTRSDLAPVSGTVKLDGQPLPEAMVEFVPQGGKGVVAVGKTDTEGNYSLMASRTAEGASLGRNRVRITTRDTLDQEGKLVPVPEKVPTKYNSATELTATVEPGDNSFSFELSTAGAKIEQVKTSPLSD